MYLRARYYDPSTQQFLTVDPALAWTEEAYAYVAGSPTNFTDPSGLKIPSPDSGPVRGCPAGTVDVNAPWLDCRPQEWTNDGAALAAIVFFVYDRFAAMQSPRDKSGGGNRNNPYRGAATQRTFMARTDQIRYSQDTCDWQFRNNMGTIGDMAYGLRKGTIQPTDIPPIRLVAGNGKLYTLDNRRLLAFRSAGMEHIPARMATPFEEASQQWKFTTRDDGMSIIIVGVP